jgi:hypothetical protein
MHEFNEDEHYDKVGLRHYRLIKPLIAETGIIPPLGKDVKTKFGLLCSSGTLILMRGFVYDGATGAIDTQEVLIPAAVHDWGCEAVNNKDLPIEYRAKFDDLFYEMLKKHGLDGNIFERVRASYMSFAVHKWGQIKHGTST